ncbi:MAG: MFS transporter [Spirochaeta sp.]
MKTPQKQFSPFGRSTLTSRLSILYFFEYGALGIVVPIFSLYLRNELGFSGSQTGTILSMAAASAFISPVVWAVVVDRLVSAERLLAFSHAVGAVLIFGISLVQSFPLVLIGYLLYMICIGPTIPLANAVVFGHIEEQGHGDYGRIRLVGTIGWISVGWFFSFVWLHFFPGGFVDALRISAAVSVCMFLWTIRLPRRRKIHPVDSLKQIFPRDAVRVVLRPQVLTVAIAMFLMAVMDRYYMYGGSPLLNSLGVESSYIMPIMTLGQLPELFALFFIVRLLRRFGYRRVLLFGLSMQFFRFGAFLVSGFVPLPFVAIGFAVHGFTYAYGIALCQMYADINSEPHTRGSVHQILELFSFGFGNIVGNISAGFLAERGEVYGATGFELFYAAALAIALIAILWIWARMPNASPGPNTQTSGLE